MSFFQTRVRIGAAGLLLVATATAGGCGGTVTPPGASAPGHPAGTSNTRIDAIPGRPFGIRVSSANKLAVTQQDLNSLTLVDASGAGPRIVVPVGRDPGEVVFNRAGTTAFVSGFFDGSVKHANVADGTAAVSTSVGDNAYRLALSPDETRLYVSTTDGRIHVLNPASASVVAMTGVAGALQGLALSVSGQILYVSSTTGRVSRLSAPTLTSSASNDVGGLPQDVAVTADGTEVVVANEVGRIDVLDGLSLASKQQIPIAGGRPFGLALSPDDLQIYVTSPATGQVIVIDRATRAIVRTISVGGTPRRVTFTADGLTAFVANEGGWVDVIK